MRSIPYIIITYLSLIFLAQADEARSVKPSINLFSNKDSLESGILVTLKEDKYKGVATDDIEFVLVIENRLDEEVFVQVTELGTASFSLLGDGIGMGSGSGSSCFLDNDPLFKRLHAVSKSEDGQIIRVGLQNPSVTVKQSAKVNLAKWIDCKGVLYFTVSGFYRSSGNHFSEMIELNFLVTDTK